MARASLPKLGAHVVFLAALGHLAATGKVAPDKTKSVTLGSVHHPERQEFAGLATAVHADGSADLIIFPPGRAPVHVENVREGTDHGEFVYAEDHKPRPKRDPRTEEEIAKAPATG